MKTKSMFVAVTLLLLACQPKKENEPDAEFELSPPVMEMTLSSSMPESPPPIIETVKFVPPNIKDDEVDDIGSSQTLKPNQNKPKKIIKDGSVAIKVNNVETAKKHMDVILAKYKAYYENENFENYGTKLSYTLKIRVPSEKFESFLLECEKGTGEITNKSINARDVTDEYVDGETRLNSKRLFRNRYNQLLEKATKIDDILLIEENIRVLQEEIESQEGHLKLLDDQVLFSVLEVVLYKEKVLDDKTIKEDSFALKLKMSLIDGWRALVDFSLCLIKQWPWYICSVVLFLMIKIYLKRRHK